jgi:hypothetical protein
MPAGGSREAAETCGKHPAMTSQSPNVDQIDDGNLSRGPQFRVSRVTGSAGRLPWGSTPNTRTTSGGVGDATGLRVHSALEPAKFPPFTRERDIRGASVGHRRGGRWTDSFKDELA